MNRRKALTATGASLLAGTALTTSAAASDDGPAVEIRSETDTSDTDGNDEYSVEYLGDGAVEITGYTVAPTPCHEAVVEDIFRSKYGDVVDLSLESGSGMCTDAIAGLDYTVRLQYDGEAPDVFVSVPDGA